jgi:hypothetical protein
MLKQTYCNLDVADVQAIANTSATILAGTHLVLELDASTGGVRPRPPTIDIPDKEWTRL